MCARGAHSIFIIYYLLSIIYFFLPPPSRISRSIPRGLSRGLTKPHRGLCCRSVRKATDTPCSRPRWRTHPQRPGKSQQKKQPYFYVRLDFGAPRSGLSRALKTPHRGVFAPRYAERGARAVLVPDGAPVRNVPGNCNKKQPYVFRKAVPWCTIGDSNPGTTD